MAEHMTVNHETLGSIPIEDDFKQMLIILLPIVGVLLTWFTGRWIGRMGAVLLTTGSVVLAWLLAVCYLYSSLSGNTAAFALNSWFSSDLAVAPWSFYLDSLTSTMFIVVLTISLIVHLYSSAYMATDPGLVRFFSYLGLFTFFMLILISADNLFLLFVGW
jgi:NADH-quinone oxidoreductase subunit L